MGKCITHVTQCNNFVNTAVKTLLLSFYKMIKEMWTATVQMSRNNARNQKNDIVRKFIKFTTYVVKNLLCILLFLLHVESIFFSILLGIFPVQNLLTQQQKKWHFITICNQMWTCLQIIYFFHWEYAKVMFCWWYCWYS
jgi:hypothetical protein